MTKERRRIKCLAITLVILAGSFLLSSCGGPEGVIKDQINDAFNPIKEADESIVGKLEEKGLSCVSRINMDDTAFITDLLGKSSIDVNVEAEDNTAEATVTFTCFDNESFNKLVKEKADEFSNSDERALLEKADRLDRGKTAVEEAVAATETTSRDVVINFVKNGDSWEPADGENLTDILLSGVISDDEITALSESLNGYFWIFDDMNASQILEKLKADGIPIGDIQVYDEDSDPNGLLGRPDEYISKASFLDTRVEDPYGNGYIDGEIDIDMGGTVETFNTAADAQAREKYISTVTSSSGIGKMYMYTFCNVVFRVGYDLKPSEAEEYEKAFIK